MDRVPSRILVAENAPGDGHELPEQGMCRFREIHLSDPLFQGDIGLKIDSWDGRTATRSRPRRGEEDLDGKLRLPQERRTLRRSPISRDVPSARFLVNNAALARGLRCDNDQRDRDGINRVPALDSRPNARFFAPEAVPDAHRWLHGDQDSPAKTSGGARGQEVSGLEIETETGIAQTTNSTMSLGDDPRENSTGNCPCATKWQIRQPSLESLRDWRGSSGRCGFEAAAI